MIALIHEVTILLFSIESSGTSWYASVFLVINAALGAGLLEFPYSFSQSGGVAAALIVQAVSISFPCCNDHEVLLERNKS